jgi:tetratricopeptide (TPR) repeat protein
MSQSADPVGTLEVALAHAARLLETQPKLAADQAEEILRVLPAQPNALLVLGLARRALGHSGDAMIPLRRAVALKPDLGPAWLALGDIYTDLADLRNADFAYGQHIQCSTRDPRMRAAGAALYDNRLAEAESLLRTRVRETPTDVAALRMLAEVAARLRRYGDAEVLLRSCAGLAPSFIAARYNLALVLHRQNKPAAALAEIDYCLAKEPHQIGYRNVKAAILGALGEHEESLRLYREVLDAYPNQARIWMSYGHALKTSGRDEEGIGAYRKSIELLPELGESYWSLANLKTFRFSAQEIGAMRSTLRVKNLDAHERFHFHFALGKALEDEADFDQSFEHYSEGNRLRRLEIRYDADENRERLRRSHALFTREFLGERADAGCLAPDPIFIVGLPRSGSTLLEQILASHSQVEGTMELPDLIAMARRVAGTADDGEGANYPGVLAALSADQWRGLGEEYLERTRIYRKRSTPFFIDKMPNNFLHLGLILVALPNAKIIDARRHPLACCLSGFKQHFAMGQHFSYSLEDVGRYYRDYVAFMAHFDRVAPGRVHRVLYESLVENTETQVRALLDYCGLDFEPSCLRFYENSRAVRTASSEQVRRPIFRDGVEQWRNFEQWLAPLKTALGVVLAAYPGVPELEG